MAPKSPKPFSSHVPYVGAAPRISGVMPRPAPGSEEKGTQQYSTVRCGYVQPNSTSAVKVGPGVYYLSPLSNVPFVKFVGAARQEKTFSWGEPVIVRENEVVTVINASYHPGDIVLSAGEGFAGVPSRITVPVPIINDGTNYVPSYPVDCRRAKSAYLIVDTIVAAGGAPVYKQGQSRERAHNTPATQVPSGYQFQENIPAGSQLTYIALGYGSQSTERGPMALLDIATMRVAATAVGQAILTNSAYYLLEYNV